MYYESSGIPNVKDVINHPLTLFRQSVFNCYLPLLAKLDQKNYKSFLAAIAIEAIDLFTKNKYHSSNWFKVRKAGRNLVAYISEKKINLSSDEQHLLDIMYHFSKDNNNDLLPLKEVFDVLKESYLSA